MSDNIKIIADREDIVAIADNIRALTGITREMTIAEMATAKGSGGSGSEDLNTELDTQEDKLNELLAILDTKAAGGGSGNTEIASSMVDGTITTYSDSMVTRVRSYAFIECCSLTTASFPICTSIGSYAFGSCSNLTTVSFPICTTISTHAFPYCANLTAASFPKCTTIGSNAFYRCSNLTTATFPECTSIGSYAFIYCANLTSVSFPKCTTIGSSAFYGCSSLTTASFPKCTTIGSGAFYDCSSLTTVSFPECTTIGGSAFYRCSSLTTVSFPECTTIGGYAFCSCSNLTSVSFPKCTGIGWYAFANCTNLTTASFPKCITIGSYAFQRCTKLSALVLTNSRVCTLSNSNVFTSTPIASKTGYIYVPRVLVSSYQTATNWTYFSTQISAIEDSEYWDGSELGGDTNSNLITFYVGTAEYQAESGMTWAEWCDSGYNTDGFYYHTTPGMVYTPDGHIIRDTPTVEMPSIGYDKKVIVDSAIYYYG